VDQELLEAREKYAEDPKARRRELRWERRDRELVILRCVVVLLVIALSLTTNGWSL
jgi:hypothetical protein